MGATRGMLHRLAGTWFFPERLHHRQAGAVRGEESEFSASFHWRKREKQTLPPSQVLVALACKGRQKTPRLLG